MYGKYHRSVRQGSFEGRKAVNAFGAIRLKEAAME